VVSGRQPDITKNEMRECGANLKTVGKRTLSNFSFIF